MENQLFQSDLQQIAKLLRYEIARDTEDQQPNLENDNKKILAKIETMLVYIRKGTLTVSTIPNAS